MVELHDNPPRRHEEREDEEVTDPEGFSSDTGSTLQSDWEYLSSLDSREDQEDSDIDVEYMSDSSCSDSST